MSDMTGKVTKICSKCLRDLPIINFRERRDKGHPLYYRGWCKNCEKRHMAECYKLNKEHKKKYAIKYYKLNKNHIAEYYKLNKERIKKYRAEYCRLNKKHIAEYRKLNRGIRLIRFQLYWKNNPWARTKSYIGHRVRREYKKFGIKNYLTTQDLRFLWFRDKAYLMKTPTIHRIDNLGGYKLENCQYLEKKEHGRLHYDARQNTPIKLWRIKGVPIYGGAVCVGK